MAISRDVKLQQLLQYPLISAEHSTSAHRSVQGSDWRVDDNELAADFDGSLSGLGIDLAGISYNMSDALLALPVFNGGQTSFQYVLAAPTSPASKVNDETLTYLNQGQMYELKVKRVEGSQSNQQDHKYYKSYIKVYFHDKRLQYTEREQIDSWVAQRPGERILEIDSPLSYGVLDLRSDQRSLNVIEFIWDSSKDCGIFIKVNCISTEFTPKKHGGEKGVPFRLQIDTYVYHDDDSPKLLSCASCQIKVFKPKGADRKQKTDRDKVEKMTMLDKEKYQPSYDYTVLTEVALDNAIVMQRTHTSKSSPASLCDVAMTPSTPPTYPQHSTEGSSGFENESGSNRSSSASPPMNTMKALTKDSTDAEVVSWLKSCRFGNYVKIFSNYTGADLLTLTREELIQICGLADGIRLNNALQVKNVRPRLTIYVNIPPESVFHVLYLSTATCYELIEKLAGLFNASPAVIVDVHLLGINEIHILVTDEVVQNMPDGAQYSVEVLKNESAEQYRVLLSRIDGCS
ncbi:transcription factor CP2-like [Watersipora subatra]|uniref:transcription factor CP2-like n=1 Tax=Watersipora subatra TaxID=2589382 RepID=UPI00355B9076